MSEKNLDDFFKQDYPKNEEIKTKEKVIKDKASSSFNEFFRNRFSFDVDVDLTDKTSILYRRNVVIKNIIFLTNLVFTFVSFIGITNSNYIITIVFFLLMTGLSQTIRYMLKKKKDDYVHQTIIMYFQSFFVFILSVLLYVKVWLGFYIQNGGSNFSTAQLLISQAVYVLIYLTIVIMSLYQNPKHLRIMFFWTLIVLTVVHFTLVHPDLYSNATNLKEFLKYMFVDNSLIAIDILLRTVVFAVLYAALYSSASISSYINDQRRNEFKKRVGVESNFTDVVDSVFEAVKVYNSSSNELEQRITATRVSFVSRELGIAMNYDQDTIQNIYEFSKVHAEKLKYLTLEEYHEVTSENFDEIMEKTKLATTIIKRLQLCKKAEDIVMAVFENQVTSDFKYNMKQNQTDRISQIILLSEIYVILRCDRNYKKALNHLRSVELINSDFQSFFDSDIISRFNKYNHEIELAYEKAL